MMDRIITAFPKRVWKISLKKSLIKIGAMLFLSLSLIFPRQLLAHGLCYVEKEVVRQGHRITGEVLDGNGDPLEGVSVFIKSSPHIGTKTDVNGRYFLNVFQNSILVFRHIAHVETEVNVGNREVINVSLTEVVSDMDEVVVVGYGTQRKSHLTGAVSSIKVAESLEGRPIADIGRGIQGASPGLSVVVPSGEVGVNPIIRIRGQIGSLNGGSKPLILMDNVEIPNLQLINPDDVESISILKDAAATSIYGAKAAFGVILITTKQGEGKDKVDINYSNNFSFQNPWKEIEMAGSNGVRYNLDAYLRLGNTSGGARFRADQESYERILEWEEKYGNTLGVNDPMVYGRDWYVNPVDGRKYGVRLYDPANYLLEQWTPTKKHNLSLGGKSGKTSFNIGLAALDQNGMMKPAKVDAFKRYNASIKLQSQISENISVRAGSMYSQADKQYPFVTPSATTGPWYWIYRWNMLFPHGLYETGEPVRGPWYEAMQSNTASEKTNFLNLNLGGTLNITKNWRTEFDYSLSNQEFIHLQPGTHFSARDINVNGSLRYDDNGAAVYVNREGKVVPSDDPEAMRAYDLPFITYPLAVSGGTSDHIRRDASNYYRHTINAYSIYDLNLYDDHEFKFMLGLNRVTYNYSSQWSKTDDLIDIINPQFNYAVGLQTASGGASWNAQLGYFSRMNYAYKDKYLFEANLRYDGSSKFPTDLKWRWFPSFSAGWVASNEEFMNWVEPVVNFLKARASWGIIGDQSVSDGLYLATMGIGQSKWIDGNGQKLSYVGTPSAVAADITWQDIITLNLGIDTRLWSNRIGLSFDWYQRKTENMIVPGPGVATTFGAGAPLGNFGSLKTQGWELELDFNHRLSNGLRLNVTGNLSDALTTITKYGTTKSIDSWYVGKRYGEIWGYQTDRLFQNSDFELDANGLPQFITLTENESQSFAGRRTYWLKTGPNGEKPIYQAGIQSGTNFFFGPGDVKFVDLNGDGEISPGNRLIDDHGDLKIIGNSTPRFLYGMRLGLDYRGLDFSAFFQGVGSRQLTRSGRLVVPGYDPAEGAMAAAIADDYWTEDNPNAFYPAAAHMGGSSTINNFVPQTRYLLDMSYLRLKTLTVGYSLPETLLNQVGLSSTRIYATLENFFTWDNLGRLPIDPEEVSGSLGDGVSSNSQLGVKAPMFKSVSFGVQLNF